jgi:23S rRNA (guanine745-N1)-methyltransferase
VRVLDLVLPVLRCPHCQAALTRVGDTLRCPSNHGFDIARQGYVSLLPPGPTRGVSGDTQPMVTARAAFLGAGHYAPIAAAVSDAAASAYAATSALDDHPATVAPGPGGDVGPPAYLLDAGAGTGYYLDAALRRLPPNVAGLALDVSKFAARHAARAHPRVGAVVCDVWRRLPVADASVSVVLNVFAPRNAPELRRVLRPAGRLIVVTPTRRHLHELIGPLSLLTVDDRKDQRLSDQLAADFTSVTRHDLDFRVQLPHSAVSSLAAMGPSAWHTDPTTLSAKLALLPDPVSVTISTTVSVFRPTGG